MRLKDYLATLERDSIRMQLGFDNAEFTLLLKPLDRVEFEEISKRCSTPQLDPITRQMVPKLNEEKLRKAIVDRVLTGWEGLTQGTVAKLSRRVCLNGEADDPVEFSAENANDLLTIILGVENEIWRETLRGVERREADETAEKKT